LDASRRKSTPTCRCLGVEQDKNRSINYKEFVAWARGKHEVMRCLEGIERIKLQTADNHSDSDEETAPQVASMLKPKRRVERRGLR
jgi:hypothetical protein